VSLGFVVDRPVVTVPFEGFKALDSRHVELRPRIVHAELLAQAFRILAPTLLDGEG
jgi:hypothetical protein